MAVMTFSDVRERSRVDLCAVAPLAAPFSLFLEATNLCNVRCKFCPTGTPSLTGGRKRGSMARETFEKIVSQIDAAGWMLKSVFLHKDGEPLLHKDYFTFCSLIRPYTEKLWLRTNGTLLTNEMIGKIAASGIDHVCVSLAATSREVYRVMAGVDIDPLTIRDSVRKLHERGKCTVQVKTIDYGMSESEKERFYEMFDGACDVISLEQPYNWSNENGVDFTLGGGDPAPRRRVCPNLFYAMAVNHDGSASACCVDWSHSLIVGNVLEEPLDRIWNGDAMDALRISHLTSGLEKTRACASCSFVDMALDDIDGCSDTILGRMAR